MIFPVFYAGPVYYYAHLIGQENISFEIWENFTKQTPRNRCTIDGPNDVTNLVVPIKKTASKMKMGDVEIAYEENWQHNHWQAIQSAYGTSPYFEFYDYLFENVYRSEPKKLIDFNLALHQIIMKCLNFSIEHSLTSIFQPIKNELDNRLKFNVKQHRFREELPEYFQVFGDRHDFRKNLSILDLIFNLGPESRTYLLDVKENYLNKD